MRTYAQNPKPTQQTTFATSTIPGRAHLEQSHEVNSSVHMQRMIRNQLSSTATGGFVHDFSQIPIRTKSPVSIQAKLTIGQPNDKYEQEADRVADQVMRMPENAVVRGQAPAVRANNENLIQRQTLEETNEEEEEPYRYGKEPVESFPILEAVETKDADELGEEEEELILPKSNTGMAPQVTAGIVRNIHSIKGTGQALPASERAFFEPRFERDFGHVRIHTDNLAVHTAHSINARAFTLGHDVVFGAGQYSPSTRSGRRLLAHELTHVVQQGGRAAYLQRNESQPVAGSPPSRPRLIPSLKLPAARWYPPRKLSKTRMVVVKKINTAVTLTNNGALFQLLRDNYSWLKRFPSFAGFIKEELSRVNQWYALGLLYYGPERTWPFPTAYRPPHSVPNTKGKLFEMLSHLQKNERTSTLLGFVTTVFSMGSQDYHLARTLVQAGAEGQLLWEKSYIKRLLFRAEVQGETLQRAHKQKAGDSKLSGLRTKIQTTAGKIFHSLRQGFQRLKGDKELDALFRRKLVGDDQWYGLGLLHYGPERNWPIPIGYQTPNTKGKFFHMLRLWRDNLLRKLKQTGGELSIRLSQFIRKVFQHGDLLYARKLWQMGSERYWDPETVRKFAKKREVQPIVTHEITGYGRLIGKRPEKAWVKLSYKDIDQNYLNDCTLMASLAAIAKTAPKLFEKMIEVHPNETVTVHFYNVATKSERAYITLLPGFPVRGAYLHYAGVTREKDKGKGKVYTEYWGALLEKAYAMWQGKGGGYWTLDKGVNASNVFRNILGVTATYHRIGSIDWKASPLRKNVVMRAAAIGKILQVALNEKRPVVMSTYGKPPVNSISAAQRTAALKFWKQITKSAKDDGFFTWHAYAVVAVRGTAVTLYNPHGKLVKTNTALLTKHFDDITVGPKLDKWQ